MRHELNESRNEIESLNTCLINCCFRISIKLDYKKFQERCYGKKQAPFFLSLQRELFSRYIIHKDRLNYTRLAELDNSEHD